MVGQKYIHFQGKDVALVLKFPHSRVIKDMMKGHKFILKEKNYFNVGTMTAGQQRDDLVMDR